jgi:hypothetical protein
MPLGEVTLGIGWPKTISYLEEFGEDTRGVYDD